MTDPKLFAPCPCGRKPTDLIIADAGQGSKWATVSGNCCGEWSIEFRTGYFALTSSECIGYATEAWNEAPRKGDCR